MFWFSCFEQFFNTWKTLCDIFVTGNPTGVECTHCKLCTRFTDRLSSDDTNCFTNFNLISCSKVLTITFNTYTKLRFTCEYATNRNFFTYFTNCFSKSWCNSFVKGSDFSPVAGSMISSANTRPTIRSSRDSIIPLPSLIASTSIPRMLLLRTLTSFASLFNTASIYSSVSGVFAGMISAPVLS